MGHGRAAANRDALIPGVKRSCLGCGRLIAKGSRCPLCTVPLYGGDYAKRAKAVRESATSCHWCKGGFTPENPVQADHLYAGDPLSPLVPACRKCNAGRGN